MASGVFISATGTDAGKTYISCRIIEALRHSGKRVCVKKPVISGVTSHTLHDSDSAFLLAANGQDVTRETIATVSPLRFSAPQSPDIAASMEGKTIRYADVLSYSLPERGCDVTLLEGAGGIMTPLTHARHSADWIKDSGFPMILIGGCYLGGISHFLTAFYTAKAFGIPVIAGVINMHNATLDSAAFMESLTAHTQNTPIHLFPENGGMQDALALTNVL